MTISSSVGSFLGVNITLRTDGRFSAAVRGQFLVHPTMNGIKALIGDTISVSKERPPIALAQLPIMLDSSKQLKRVDVTGITVEKPRGEAPRPVLSTSEGPRSVLMTYNLWDEDAAAEYAMLREEWFQADLNYAARAAAILKRFKTTSGEAVVHSLTTGEPIAATPTPTPDEQAVAESN